MFSKTCEYGLRATIYVAQKSELEKRVGVKEIAEAIESPVAFTGKIMQKLTKNGIIKSIKGPYGGFFIESSDLKKIKLSEIIIIFDGKNAYAGCILGLPTCSEDLPCPLHEEYKPIMKDIRKFLENKTLYDILYKGDKMNKFWLKRA